MKRKIKVLIIITLIFIIFIIGLLMSNTYSKFISKIAGKSNTEVAEPIFILENTDKKVLDSSNTEIDYYFTIKNYNDIKKSDVDLKYNIEITPIQDKSIILSLYKDNQKIELTNQKTQYVDLLHSNNTKHEYRLNVKYDKSNLGNCYDISSNIFIKANAIQK